MSDEAIWRTFCHISEYDEWGYRNLHRMIAGSDPLVVWAPSSQLLKNTKACRVTDKEFLEFVEAGRLRVAAREPWIRSQTYRNNHRWKEGARWDLYVDAALRRMAIEDEHVPDKRERRVLMAPEEEGWEKADEHIAEYPDAVDRLVADIESERAEDLIPPGTLQAARAQAGSSEEAARVVLRDAYNHGEAIAYTEVDTAVLLAAQDSAFLEHLTAVHANERALAGTYAARDEELRTRTTKELADQLLELLERIEIAGEPPDLNEFLASGAHQELVGWVRGVADRLHRERPDDLRDALRRDLAERLREARFAPVVSRFDIGAGAAGTGSFAAGVHTGIDPLAIGGLVLDVIPLANALLKKLNWVKRDFSGPQWPFRYAYRSHATPKRVARFLRILE